MTTGTRLSAIVCVLLVSDVICHSQQTVYKSPQHDLRVSLDFSVPQRAFESFYNLYYGDTIRLGEFYCGDPRFLLHVNEEVELSANGYLTQDGSYGSLLHLKTGLNGKIYENCFGFHQPSVGGWGELGTTLSNVSDLTDIKLNGYFTIGALAYIFGIKFPIDTNIKLPIALNKIPIDLTQTRDGTVLDFVGFTNGHWEHNCPCQHKDIPVVINVGSFGQLGTFGDGTSRGNSRLVIDASVGTQRYVSFDGADAQKQQTEDFESDNPVPDLSTVSAPNIGVSIKDSFFGARSESSKAGFLGELLPIRVTGQSEYKILWWRKRVQYEIVLDGASVSEAQAPDGTPIMNVSLSSGYALLRDIKKKNGHTIIGPGRLIKRVTAAARFDRFRYDIDANAVRFNVSDFGLKIKTWWFVFPIRLSAGQLEEALNHGIIDVAQVAKPFDLGLERCINTGYEKFKSAAAASCNESYPNVQLIGYLSYEPQGEGGGGVPPYKRTFHVDPNSVLIQRQKEAIHFRLRLTEN
jgi:hypothetical protein